MSSFVLYVRHSWHAGNLCACQKSNSHAKHACKQWTEGFWGNRVNSVKSFHKEVTHFKCVNASHFFLNKSLCWYSNSGWRSINVLEIKIFQKKVVIQLSEVFRRRLLFNCLKNYIKKKDICNQKRYRFWNRQAGGIAKDFSNVILQALQNTEHLFELTEFLIISPHVDQLLVAMINKKITAKINLAFIEIISVCYLGEQG